MSHDLNRLFGAVAVQLQFPAPRLMPAAASEVKCFFIGTFCGFRLVLCIARGGLEKAGGGLFLHRL